MSIWFTAPLCPRLEDDKLGGILLHPYFIWPLLYLSLHFSSGSMQCCELNDSKTQRWEEAIYLLTWDEIWWFLTSANMHCNVSDQADPNTNEEGTRQSVNNLFDPVDREKSPKHGEVNHSKQTGREHEEAWTQKRQSDEDEEQGRGLNAQKGGTIQGNHMDRSWHFTCHIICTNTKIGLLTNSVLLVEVYFLVLALHRLDESGVD